MKSTFGLMAAGGILSLAAAHVSGANLPEYPCHRLAEAPVMDGRAADAAWQTLPEAAGFFIIGGQDYAVAKPTFFRAGWAGDSLYLFVKCVEPALDKIKASPADGDRLWTDDAIEMFFAPDSKEHYVQLIANSIGTRWNGRAPDIEDYPEPWEWEARPGRWEQGWLLEIRIPFALLGRTPQDGERWAVNVARELKTGPSAEAFTCWPPLRNGFSDRERFGSFVFKAAPLSAAQAGQETRRINADFNADLRAQAAQAGKLSGTPEFLDALKHPLLKEAAGGLTAAAGRLAGLAQSKSAGPGELAAGLSEYRSRLVDFTQQADGLRIPLKKVPVKRLTLEIKARAVKDLRLYVNGRETAIRDNRAECAIYEGLTAISVSAAAAGKNPGIALHLAGHPETDGRWRAGSATGDQWTAVDFDDRSWPPAADAGGGGLWSADAASAAACFRQLVLWNETHNGPLPALQPRVREWGFSEGSMETLFHILYSPLRFPLENYEFILDVPKDFKLLEEKAADDQDTGRASNRQPKAFAAEEVLREGRSYRRYRWTFAPDCLSETRTQCMLIPLVLDKFSGSADQAGRFYYRRTANGNLTELEQFLPVRVLPPLNGRMPKKVMISQYSSVPWGSDGTRLSPKHLEAHVRQSLAVGFNYWFIGAWKGEYRKRVYDQVLEGGGHVVLCYNNYPIHGANIKSGALHRWLQSDPAAQARYFNDSDSWTNRAQFCPSHVTGAGAAKFKEAVQADIAAMLKGGELGLEGLPKAEIYWTDWEQEPWNAEPMGYKAARTGDRSYCFCERCKEAFRGHAGLPAASDLSDDEIWKSHKGAWSRFRSGLDGRIQGLVKQACNALGLPYMVYSGVNQRRFWDACKGNIDMAFLGCPGNAVAGSHNQKYLDATMAYFKDRVGLERVLGQRFSFFGGYYMEKYRWRFGGKWTVLSPDGYVNAKSWKPQTLRLVATFRQGVDFQNSIECCAGMLYYIGEATRIISAYEDLFWDGERADDLAASDQIGYPDLLVLKKGEERLVLLFNEGLNPLTVTLQNKRLKPGQKGVIYGTSVSTDNPGKMEITIAPEDAAVVHIK